MSFTPLPSHQLIALRGPEAPAFAQAQFANDVTHLRDGCWQWSTWLNAKGRIIAIFMLCRISEAELLMVLADGDAADIAAQLSRYVFRRKMRIDTNLGLTVSGAYTVPPASGPAILREQDTYSFDLGSSLVARCLRITPHTDEEASVDFEHRWRTSDLQMGLPRLEPSQRLSWTPQQLGLDRLSAYSVSKGCYPGQEIVARTHFLGKAKRSVQLLQVPAGSAAGDAVNDQAGHAIGTLASVAGPFALAVLPLEADPQNLLVASTPVQVSTILEGLAR